MPNLDKLLNDMRKAGKIDVHEKGNLGEDAVLYICYERKKRMGNGLLYQSYKYPYQTNRDGVTYTGNIKFENNQYVEYTKDTLFDEIDVLYITPYRIFPIEVKSYNARALDIYDHWFNRNSTPVDKSPIAQAEKHARHLYHAISPVLPDGNPDYIVPLVCFVDKCKVRDKRSEHFAKYIPVCVLNNLLKTLQQYNTPLEYNLDLGMIEKQLNEVHTSIRRTL